jgi:hypothetical protein
LKLQSCHTAALALIGWYLISPPSTYDSRTQSFALLPNAPISKWKVIDSYDSAGDCNSVRDEIQKAAHDPAALAQVNKETAKRGEPPLDSKFALESAHEAFCISTDDPRLKER